MEHTRFEDSAEYAHPLYEHQHVQLEVWPVVDGTPPDIVHSVRPISACRVVVADHPLPRNLPGVATAPAAGAGAP